MELKPCPICGGKAFLSHVSIFGDGTCVKCVQCNLQTKFFKISTEYASDEKAADAWNRRAADAER